jgi:hypothetical protein
MRSLFLFEGKLAATVMKCDYAKSQYTSQAASSV